MKAVVKIPLLVQAQGARVLDSQSRAANQLYNMLPEQVKRAKQAIPRGAKPKNNANRSV